MGSIAALYLGDSSEVITGKTPTDPKAERRADYARGKAISERLLLDMHEREGLPVTILRPGLVVGEGGIPFHTGVGFYNNEQHCLGWNAGQNPLPFVLVEDVAAAIGRVFSHAVMAKASPVKAPVDGLLLRLHDLDFVYPASLGPRRNYSFNHVLVQETVYSTLLHGKRMSHPFHWAAFSLWGHDD